MVVLIVVRWGVRIPHLLNYALTVQHGKIDRVYLLIPVKHHEPVVNHLNTYYYDYVAEKVVVKPLTYEVWSPVAKRATDDIPRPYIVSYPNMKQLEKVVREALGYVKRDEIVFNVPEPFWLGTYFVAREFVSKGIGMLTTTSFENVLSSPVKFVWKTVEETVKSLISVYLASTVKSRHFLVRLGVPEDKIRVIYPGIDVKRFKPKECNSRRGGESLTFLYVGRLDLEKGVKELINAWKSVERTKRCGLMVVGEGRFRKAVSDLARKGLNVKYVGYVSDDDLPRIYHLGDIFLYLSKPRHVFFIKIWEEQFGFAVAEALASGLTALVSTCGALPEVVPSPPNILLDVKNIAAKKLSKIMLELCENVTVEKLCRNSVQNRVFVEERYNVWRQSLKIAETIHQG